MFKMSNPFTFTIYKKSDPFSRELLPIFLIKVNEFYDRGTRMVLCIKLTLMMSRVITLFQENIPYDDFVSNWQILSPDELKSGGYMILQQIFNGLNFALLETGKTPDSLTSQDLGRIIDTATQKYSLWLRDPTNGVPGLNQTVW